MTGLTPPQLKKSGIAALIEPRDREKIWSQVQEALAEQRPFQLQYRIRTTRGRLKWVWEQGVGIFTAQGEVEAVEGFITDISERKSVEQALERKARELAASNAELEQFAYAASHDLQEPLRMISGYAQLLARRYHDKLDKDAEEFIHFITDGVERMQRLIHDLLAYSRAGRSPQSSQSVELSECVRDSLANLRKTVEENQARVEIDSLPRLTGQRSQFVQLFQNLIGNAVKYHGDQPPTVRVTAERREQDWLFGVRDNGIGIDPQYQQQVFELFHRLHGRKEYSGTGIGLAICKKIVESHGGTIWVDSQPGQGATFWFTLPDGDSAARAGAEAVADNDSTSA